MVLTSVTCLSSYKKKKDSVCAYLTPVMWIINTWADDNDVRSGNGNRKKTKMKPVTILLSWKNGTSESWKDEIPSMILAYTQHRLPKNPVTNIELIDQAQKQNWNQPLNYDKVHWNQLDKRHGVENQL